MYGLQWGQILQLNLKFVKYFSFSIFGNFGSFEGGWWRGIRRNPKTKITEVIKKKLREIIWFAILKKNYLNLLVQHGISIPKYHTNIEKKDGLPDLGKHKKGTRMCY